jgi:hypothetical protein
MALLTLGLSIDWLDDAATTRDVGVARGRQVR